MSIGRNRFNIYFFLLALLTVALVAGCKTKSDSKKKKDEHEKEVANLRVHVEVTPQSMDFSTTVPILREHPVMITVDKSPFLTELNVTGARVVEVIGGFNLEIHFDRQGTWLLESYTVSNSGRHFAIFSAFGDKKKKQSRWLGAPVITHKISDGVLSFTPDASREEADEIALGLNNTVKANQQKSQW
jgi:hypothetical protein